MNQGIVSRSFLVVRLVWDITISTAIIFLGGLLPRTGVPSTDLSGRSCVVTGANSGIGYELALQLAKRGATVYLACRSISKGQQAASEIIDAVPDSQNCVHVLELDTSSLQSVRKFAAGWTSGGDSHIDVLIHNAGITSAPGGKQVSDEGLGMIYTTNFLGSFVLTNLLERHLNDQARVIFTSSTGQYGGNLKWLFHSPKGVPQLDPLTGKIPDSGLYAHTKLMQVVFCKLLQERWDRQMPEKRLITHAFTPGYTFTPIFDKTDNLPVYVDPVWWFLKVATVMSVPVEQGAATGLWLATTDDRGVVGESKGAGYWDRCTRRLTSAELLSPGRLQRAWDLWCADGGVDWA